MRTELKFHIQFRLKSVFEGIITVIVRWKEKITSTAVRLNTGGSDVKPATARQVLIGIKLHTKTVLLNDITNKVTRNALDIHADMGVERWGSNRAPTVPGLFGRGQAYFIKKKHSKY